MVASKDRAGRYIKQPTGYRAFVPAPLPPDPPLRIEGALPGLLSKADQALGRLDGSVLTLPDPDLFVFMYVRKEAVLSSQIEGTQSSLQDLLTAEAKLQDPDRPLDVEEVVNYVRALRFGMHRRSALPVSVRLIREIHEELMRGVSEPPHEVPAALGALEQYLHTDDATPVLVRIALAHAQFETIHPFLDGNGRVGRLLITLLLTEAGILHQPVLYLSHWFKANRQAYYDHLQAVRDAGAWEAWVAFFLQGVIAVATEATETARRILDLREQDRGAITVALNRGAANGLRVLDSLYERPIVSVNQVREITGTTYAAANTLVARLVSLGILTELTGQSRNRRYQYKTYVDLFAV